MYAYKMNVDLDQVSVEPIEDGHAAFHTSRNAVLERIAPRVATAPGMKPEERVRRLGAARGPSLRGAAGCRGAAVASLRARAAMPNHPVQPVDLPQSTGISYALRRVIRRPPRHLVVGHYFDAVLGRQPPDFQGVMICGGERLLENHVDPTGRVGLYDLQVTVVLDERPDHVRPGLIQHSKDAEVAPFR